MFDPNMQFPDWPGSHPGVSCQFFLALISWMLGYPDRSLEELRAAVGSAETLGHPLTLAQTLCFAALLHIFRHEPPAAADYAGAGIEDLRGAPHRAVSRVCPLRGWMGAQRLWRKREGAGSNWPRGGQLRSWGVANISLLALQADAQLAIGKPEAALASVAAGLKVVEKTGGAPLEAELHRLKGEALLAGAGTVSEAETAIEKGIDVARRQNAKSWELRAATSLARLRRQQGRQQEAAALLAPIYAWFTEGFDTADLQAGRTLLADLQNPATLEPALVEP